MKKHSIVLAVFITAVLLSFTSFGQTRHNRQQFKNRHIQVEVDDSTYQADSVPYLNPKGKTIIGTKRAKHNIRLYKEVNGHGFFVLDEHGNLTGQTDSSEIDKKGRKKRRHMVEQDRSIIEEPIPAMIPFDKQEGRPLEPEMGELVASNEGFAEVDVVISYKAWLSSGLTPESYISTFMLRYAIAAQHIQNGGAKVRVRNIKVNTSPDNYTGAGSSNRLSQFRLDYPNHTAHGMLLIDDEPGNGGVAYMATMCNAMYSGYRYMYCSMKLGTAPFGKYSYDTYVLTHEQGHWLWLNHAFWCGYEVSPGVFKEIDQTYNCEAFNGIKCFTGSKGSTLGEVMGYSQLWGNPDNFHFDVVTSKKLSTVYQTATGNGCITGGTVTPTCTSFIYSAWGPCVGGQRTRTILSQSPVGCIGGSPVLTESCVVPPTDTSTLIFYKAPDSTYRTKMYFSKAIGKVWLCRYSGDPTGNPPNSNCGQRTTPTLTATDIANGFVDFKLDKQPGNTWSPPNPVGNYWYVVKRQTKAGDIYSNKLFIKGK
jgi:hypothetical protein